MTVTDTYVDVLIIGAGPAGHMAANWFARAGVENVRIIDKRGSKIFAGQADGLQCRTLEVFQSFGFGDRAQKEANAMLELCFWEPDANGKIHRAGRAPDTIVGISRFQQVVLHQGRIESWFQDAIKKWSHDKLKIERPWLPESLDINESKVDDKDAYPVTVTMRKLSEEEATPDQFNAKVANGLFRAYDDSKENAGGDDADREIVHAKYVIGCDGAHSWVRKQLGIEMEGDSSDFIWGVLDAVPITNFPDIRNRCSIHSADSGSIMVIPRENGLVRLYTQLKEAPRDPGTTTEGADSQKAQAKAEALRVDRSKVTPEFILENARKIFAPYTLDITDLKWYTAYQIGQRVSPSFQKNNRVFIAGDACHTHSPKAGQGMNVSLMDTYNLGWKIAHVLKGLASPDILATYEQERRQIARQLIEFDYKFSRLFSGKPKSSEEDDGISLDEFKQFFVKGNEFASGTIVDYDSSDLVKKPSQEGDHEKQYIKSLATGCPIGRRFNDAQIVMQSDSMTYYLNDRIPSDGRFRVVYFAGDLKVDELYKFMQKFGGYLEKNDTFIKKYTPAHAKLDSVIEVLLLHAAERTSIEWEEFPEAFRPRDYKRRMDYWKIMVDGESYHRGHGHAYKKYGIDPKVGAFVVLRPDGYVATVEELSEEGISNIAKYFEGFMIEQKPSWSSNKGQIIPKDEEDEWYGKADYGKPVLAV